MKLKHLNHVGTLLDDVTISDVPVMDMFFDQKLIGKGHEASNFLSAKFNHTDFTCRGHVFGDVHHSWIEFLHEKNWNVFDPAMGVLMPKDKYYKDFDAKVIAKISSKTARHHLAGHLKDNNWESTFIKPGNHITDPFYLLGAHINAEPHGEKHIGKMDIGF